VCSFVFSEFMMLRKKGIADTFDSAETVIMTSSSAYSIRRPRIVSFFLFLTSFFTSLPVYLKSFYNLPSDHVVVQEPSIESDAGSEVRRPWTFLFLNNINCRRTPVETLVVSYRAIQRQSRLSKVLVLELGFEPLISVHWLSKSFSFSPLEWSVSCLGASLSEVPSFFLPKI